METTNQTFISKWTLSTWSEKNQPAHGCTAKKGKIHIEMDSD